MGSQIDPTAEIVDDANWLAHRLDYQRNAYRFLHVPRELHDQFIFLTDEYFPADLEQRVLPRAEAMMHIPALGPLHFVFHSAFCCSTLIARALDIPGVAMGLKEPALLNDIVGYGHHANPTQQQMVEALKEALQLLARPFSPNEAVVVKASSIVNGLAEPILAMRPESKALLMHAPLPVFLGSIARKELWGRLWAREHFVGLRKQNLIHLGFTDEQHFGQTDLQIAAAGWLTQHMIFDRLVKRFGPDRVRTIDSETFLARIGEGMETIARLFELGLGQEDLRRVVEGPVFRHHSKFGGEFDSVERKREQADGATVHADEIEKVTVWAEKVAETVGIPMTLGAPLLS